MDIHQLSQRAKIAIVVALLGLVLAIVAFGMSGAGFVPIIDFYVNSVFVAEREGFNAIPAGGGISIVANDSAGKVDYTFTVTATSTNSFETIDTSEGTDPVATGSNDTLTLIANGLQILGDASTDSITFTVTAGGVGTVDVQENGVDAVTGTSTFNFLDPFDVIDDTGNAQVSLDTTEIGTTTFGSGSAFTWTFDSNGSPTTAQFAADGTYSLTSLSGNVNVQSLFAATNIIASTVLNLISSGSIDLELGNTALLDFIFNGVLEYRISQTEADWLGNNLRNVGFTESNTANPSTIGAVRLGNIEDIGWRNSGNTANLTLEVSSVDVFEFTGASLAINNTTNCNSIQTDSDGILSCAGAFIVDKSINFTAPVTSADTNLAHLEYGTTVTITEVSCSTDSGTITIQLDERARATPNTAGTDVMTSALVCDSDTETTTTFTNANISANTPLNLQLLDSTGTVNVVRIHIKANKD